ncbi:MULTISPECIES: hypothetical protein [Reichenbachiella]|uniref:hypothetical protein n=1 Tax=Reichenbachiella TaxID=156993 RepID=UPI000E6CF062|nr:MULTISPECIES: hypothetical protein [Reichenbachiella]MBU2913970.1 hypothetical protein [Reichenbachiella agariperforans]RJE74121.1 hypothetical protein BGP76_13065 [Reichenbachiella sp. MSK19-1]
MKRKSILFLVSVLASISISAQVGTSDSTDFVVTSGETIRGVVKVNLERNDLMIRSGRHIYNWTADKVDQVSVLDPSTGERHEYLTGGFGMNEGSFFFEVLSVGQIVLLYREGLKFSQYDETTYPPFYILQDGVLHSLAQNKKEFMSLFDGDYASEMSDYFKSNDVDISDRMKLKQMFTHYNAKFSIPDHYYVTNR